MRTRLALGWLALLGFSCAESPHVFDFGGDDGKPRGCVSEEICDGLDNDCDGEIDNVTSLGPLADEQRGQCQGRHKVCVGGRWTEPERASVEADCMDGNGDPACCNARDDDCDGKIDEDFTETRCEPDEFDLACDRAQRFCLGGQVHCLIHDEGHGHRLPFVTSERCDGFDNDCDGSEDEGLGPDVDATCVLPPAHGVCERDGTVECTPTGGTACVADPGGSSRAPEPETCDGRDDDCDGVVDEDAANVGDACADAGGCSGTQVCRNGGLECEATRLPEVCNGLDDDCDGSTDEGERAEAVLDCVTELPNAAARCEAGACTTRCLDGFFGEEGRCDTAEWASLSISGFNGDAAKWCGVQRRVGRIRCWSQGQDGRVTDLGSHGLSDEEAEYREVVTTAYFTCGLLQQGELRCVTPHEVSLPRREWMTQDGIGGIAGAGATLCALRDDAVTCSTGEAVLGQVASSDAFSVGGRMCGIPRGHHQPVCWDDGAMEAPLPPVPIEGADALRFAKVSVGLRHYCALARNGQVRCWALDGRNLHLCLPETVDEGAYFEIAVGADVACGLTGNGEAPVVCWTLPYPDDPAVEDPDACQGRGSALLGAGIMPVFGGTEEHLFVSPLSTEACVIDANNTARCWSLRTGAARPVWSGETPGEPTP